MNRAAENRVAVSHDAPRHDVQLPCAPLPVLQRPNLPAVRHLARVREYPASAQAEVRQESVRPL